MNQPFLSRVSDAIRGLRTLLTALLFAALAAVNAADVVQLFTPEQQKWALVGVPVVFALLRLITTGPVRLK